jgi:hypothetical protein
MGSTLYFLAVAALMTALQVEGLAPASAEENAAPPQSQTQPQQPSQERQLQEPQPPAPARRDSEEQDSDSRRFVFHRVDGNLLRLDMRTGAVATCGPTGADWTCAPGRDERAALDRQIARLQRDNAILKNALLEHGVPLPEGMAPAPPSGPGGWLSGDDSIPRPPQTVPPTAAPKTAPGNPTQGASPEGDVDRIMDAVERSWRRIVQMMTDLKRDFEK